MLFQDIKISLSAQDKWYEVGAYKSGKASQKVGKASRSRRISPGVIKRIWKIINNTNAMRWQYGQLGR